jgi:hypothetical protein
MVPRPRQAFDHTKGVGTQPTLSLTSDRQRTRCEAEERTHTTRELMGAHCNSTHSPAQSESQM